MADFPLPDDTAQRYAELEKAYVEERWSTVLAKGQTLLATIESSDDPQAEGMANRVRVLLGHAHLYGLAEPEVAEDYYRSVLGSRAEPELRRIAAEGLQQCQRPPAPRAGAEAREPALATREPAVVQPVQAVDAASASEARTEARTEAPTPEAEAAGAAAGTPASGEGVPAAEGAEPDPGLSGPDTPPADPFLAAVLAGSAATPAAPGTAAAAPWLADLPQDFVTPAPATTADPFAGAGPAAAVVAETPVTPAGAAEPAGALEPIPSLEVDVVEEPELVEVAQADPSLAEELELELSRIRERRASAGTASGAAAETAAEATNEEALDGEREPFKPVEELSAPPAGIAAGDAVDPFAAAITAALGEVEGPAAAAASQHAAASQQGPELGNAPKGSSATASGFTGTTQQAASGISQPAAAMAPPIPAEEAPDLSGEDPELVAGLLGVVIRP